MSTILGKFLVVGPNTTKIDKIVAILASREVTGGDSYLWNRCRPSSKGPLFETDDNKYYWEVFWSLPKNIYENKFGPYKKITSTDLDFSAWRCGDAPEGGGRAKPTCQYKPNRSIQVVGLPDNVFKKFRTKCDKTGVSMSRFLGACVCYILDYIRVDKNGNPDGFSELIPLLSADSDPIIEETAPDPAMELKFVKRKSEIPIQKTVRDVMVEHFLSVPTPNYVLTKNQVAKKIGTSSETLWTEKNNAEYERWERAFFNLNGDEEDQIFSPALNAVFKKYFQKPRNKFPRRYEIAEIMQIHPSQLFNLKTEECQNNQREYDKWKKRYQEGNI